MHIKLNLLELFKIIKVLIFYSVLKNFNFIVKTASSLIAEV